MDYADELPPRYKYLWGTICAVFNVYPYLKFPSPNKGSEPLTYTLIYKSPLISSLKQARIILTGENHYHAGSRTQNGHLIDQFIRPSYFLHLYSEGISPTEKPIEGLAKKLTLEILKISAASSPNLLLFGWDDYNHLKEKADAREQNKPEPEHITDKIALINKARIASNEFLDLSEARGMDHSTTQKAQANLEKRLIAAGIDPNKGYDDKLEKIGEELEEEVSKEFPKRTEKMVATLETVNNLIQQKKLDGLAIFAAGGRHLEAQENEKDPRYSLDLLYQMIKKLPAVIVLPTSISPIDSNQR